MPRELSKAEQVYIRDNHDKISSENICADMPGVGKKTVEKFIEDSVIPEMTKDQTPEDRIEQLKSKTGITAGELMGRNEEAGVVVMTSGASELGDVQQHKSSPTKTAKEQPERIFIMDKDKRVR